MNHPKCGDCGAVMFKATCSSCEARAAPASLPEGESVSILSKQHPFRLFFRGLLILIVFPPLIGPKAYDALMSGDYAMASAWSAFLALGMLLSGIHVFAYLKPRLRSASTS